MRSNWALVPVLAAASAVAAIVPDVRKAIAEGDFPRAESLVQQFRAAQGTTPEMLEALSWLGRGSLAAKQLDTADKYAKETQQLSETALKTRALDAEPHLPLALGAAIEVQALVLNERGERNEAVSFLRKELAAYRNTSIRTRLQKNINLLSMEGKPAPALHATEFLGRKPVNLASLKGKPVLVFFWAHWCPDCKADAPLIAQLRSEFASKGLAVVGPTQRYGYVAKGEEAPPAEELKYIEEIRQQYYKDLLDVPVPVSEENFKVYGASTTPTFVFIDTQGIVRLYHPGKMTLEEMRAAVSKLG
jgi:thiol-disulfide isomerase/thioredoxin